MKTALVDVTNRANVKEHGSTSSLDHYHSSKMHCSVNSRGAMQQLQKREHLVTAGAGSQRRSQREVTRGGSQRVVTKGPYKDEQLHNVNRALLCCMVQGRPVALVLHHNQLLASSIQKGCHNIHMAHLSSKMQGGLEALRHAAHIRLLLDEHLHQGQPACPSNKTESSGVSHAAHIGLLLDEHLHQRQPACPANTKQYQLMSVMLHIGFLLDEHPHQR